MFIFLHVHIPLKTNNLERAIYSDVIFSQKKGGPNKLKNSDIFANVPCLQLDYKSASLFGLFPYLNSCFRSNVSLIRKFRNAAVQVIVPGIFCDT